MLKTVKKAQTGKKLDRMDMNRKDSVPSEMFPGKMIPKSKSNYGSGVNIATGKSSTPVKKAVPKKKMKSGGSFGMLSVKAGVDKNPNPTAADRIAGAKMNAGKAKSGKKVMMKGGGKCKSGC